LRPCQLACGRCRCCPEQEQRDGYLHATVSSAIFGFVDDLELFADPGGAVLQARSVSRLGDSDLGVNSRRLAALETLIKG
jgi:uncharacterized protein (DUF1499 family)